MDASHSPVPPGGVAETGGETDEDAGSQRGRSFFLNMIMRAAEALGSGGEHDGSDAAGGLRAAFARASPAERTMIANILRLQEMRVEDVMTPRADIVAVAEEATLEEVTQAYRRGSLSRLPVFRETLDDPIGFVHLKDLALAYGIDGVGGEGAPAEFRLSNHLRKALYVPPSMRIAALMQRMQAARVHLALVIDEFGGVDGLVTIEDLVEQVVGDIEDEHDTEETAPWREESPGVWIADARSDVEEFEEATGASLLPEDWEEEVDTLGGLVFMLTGRVPARGEVIGHPMGHEFEVTDADPRRIRRLRITLHGAVAASAAAAEDAAG
jgi:magnesium and cobalt transporter